MLSKSQTIAYNNNTKTNLPSSGGRVGGCRAMEILRRGLGGARRHRLHVSPQGGPCADKEKKAQGTRLKSMVWGVGLFGE